MSTKLLTPKTALKPSKVTSELTLQQKQILANAGNILGFFMPVLNVGIRSFDLVAEDIQGVYLYGETYELKTTYGSNSYDRTVFKAAVTLYK